MFCTGSHPVRSKNRKPPVFVRFCAPSYEDSIKLVIIKKFKQMVIRADLKGGNWAKAWSEKGKTLTFKNGSTVNFKSGEQQVNKFAGDDLDACYQDEHLGKKYYNENKLRLADRAGYFVSSMTPEEGAISWEKKHIKKKKNKIVDMFKFSIYGNPHISKQGIENVLATITDPRLLKVKMEGEFVALAGLVYEGWDENIHMIDSFEIPVDWPRVFCIDPHLKKPAALMWAAWHPEGKDLFVYRAMLLDRLLTVPELKKLIRIKSAGETIQLWMGDEAQGGDGTNIYGNKSVIEELNDGDDGLPIVGTNHASSKIFKAGVMKVRGMLRPDPITGKASLYCFKEYQGKSNWALNDEFDEYQFLPDTKADEATFRERVRLIDDDLLDDLRYIVMAGCPSHGGSVITSAQNDKWSESA